MADEVWEEFRRTCVRIGITGGVIDVVPIPRDTPGSFIPGAAGPIHIVTAQNPMGLAASDTENIAANERLADELAALDGVTVWPATGYGGGPVDGDGTWSEAGFAIQGLDDDTALDVARRYRQRAIFTWRNEPGGFRLVACDGSADEPRGWVATFVADP